MENGPKLVSVRGTGSPGSQHGRQSSLHRGLFTLVSAAILVGSTVVFAAVSEAGAAPPSAPTITNFPRQALAPSFGVRNTWAASNWSGYAETGSYTGVSGTWTVPMVAASTSATYSSAWIGVDGFNDSNLIQTGTEEDFSGGAAHYNAWWEILPASETALPGSYAVTGGDRMSASIYETSGTATSGGFFRRSSEHVWVITISHATRVGPTPPSRVTTGRHLCRVGGRGSGGRWQDRHLGPLHHRPTHGRR